MSAEKFKVVARLGLEANIPTLEVGEFGWDVDKKVFRVGDDTNAPTRIATNKSIGRIDYSQNFTVKYGTIELYADGKIDGVDPSTMNQNDGIVVRTADGVFNNRKIAVNTDYLAVTNPDGKAGDPTLTLSPEVIELIGGEGTTAVKFSFGPTFPENAFPGHLHYDTDSELLFIKAKQLDETMFWLDFSSVVGGNIRSIKFYYQSAPPVNVVTGDQWYDTELKRLFIRMTEENNSFWLEHRI